MLDTNCLRSTVRNTSGETKTFSFLPPNGKEMEADEELSFVGTPSEAISRYPGHGKRHLDALEAALLDGSLTILNTPAPILFDEVTQNNAMLVLSGGTLAAQDPCWESASA